MKLYSDNLGQSINKGFTLLEMMVVVIIVGVIAAIAAPNLLGMLRRYQVNNALVTLTGAVKEAQRQATRQGISCNLVIDTATGLITGAPTVPNPNPNITCLSEQKVINSDINIRSNIAIPALNTISFSAKGNSLSDGTIVFSYDSVATQRCFAIAPGLGITRTGIYTGAKTGPVNTADCDSTQN